MSYPHAVRQHCAVAVAHGRVRARFEPPTSTSSTATSEQYPYVQHAQSQPARQAAIASCCPTSVHDGGQMRVTMRAQPCHARERLLCRVVSQYAHNPHRYRARIVSGSCLWCAPCRVGNVTHTVRTRVRFKTRQRLVFIFLRDVVEQPLRQ